MSASLLRARRPFFLRNMVTGIAVASFAIGVWAYSISAVKQDVFDDVDEQARALNSLPNDPPPAPAVVVVAGNIAREPSVEPLPLSDSSKHARGLVFAALGNTYPWLFEPIHKTLVWGAPPVDHIGRIEDKMTIQWRK
jgi:cytochrome c oxidase assembly factor 3, fungi type